MPPTHSHACLQGGWVGSPGDQGALIQKKRQWKPGRRSLTANTRSRTPADSYTQPSASWAGGDIEAEDGLAPGPVVAHSGSRAGEEEKGTVRYKPSSAGTQGTQQRTQSWQSGESLSGEKVSGIRWASGG